MSINNNLSRKIEHMNKRNKIEDIIINLEKIHDKDIETLANLNKLKKEFEKLQEQIPDDSHKKYLSEIIREEEPKFGTNNLILAPVGSGKTTLIKDIIESIELEENQKVLMLVSNRFLKDSTYEDSKKDDNNSFSIATTQSLKKQKNENSKVNLMTYHEFSYKIQNNNEFMNNIIMVFCDEIHSLPEYRSYISNKGGNYVLEHSIKYLFSKHIDKQIFYFTATDENLLKLEKKRKSLLKDVITFDYRKHPDIKQYMELSKSFITHIEQVRPFLKSRLESFEYFKHKGVAFTKTITSQKVIERILIEEGFKPLVLWSDNNNEHPLSEEQISARTSLIKDGKIPEPYNFLIMNSALREGWNLYDSKVKLAIMNTTTETDLIQARGRVRRDIDLVIYKTTGQLEKLNNPELVEKYLNKPLTTENKEQLCIDLNLKNNNGRLMKWRAIKELLEKENYILKNSKITIEGKRVNVTIITPPL